MSSAGAPPTIPVSLQIYNSYLEDPIWQLKFTAIWCSFLGATIAISLPSLVRAFRQGRALTGLFGVSGGLGKKGYSAVKGEEGTVPSLSRGRKVAARWNSLVSIRHWAVPYLDLNIGQVFVLGAYLATTFVCIFKDAPLVSNPNRAGFLAFAQFPIVFLFATKNSLLSFLLGPGNGYEQLNFLHRMAGRVMFLGALIHGALWIRNHIQYGLPILGPQKETSGVASLAMLSLVVLFSLGPIRRWFYQVFFVFHVITFVGFFVCVCYHSMYASPWIFPPLAFYGADIFMRLLRYRFKDATVTAPDKFMTLVRIHDCDGGWVAGQHVCLRVFFSGRILESHPLSILSAPPAYSCLSNPGLLLGARVNGDWTQALNNFVHGEHERIPVDEKCNDKDQEVSVPLHVMVDGPYGGSSVDLGQYETVFLVSGGSGITFTLGLLDDIVGRCVKLRRRGGERTRRIEFAWYIRSYGNMYWFTPMLTDIASTAVNSSIDLHISIFVTCLCDPDAVPVIPHCDVMLTKPPIYGLLHNLTSSPRSDLPSCTIEEDGQVRENVGRSQVQPNEPAGGVAVCASGPASLTREAQNAVARLGVMRGNELGGVAIHVEQFTL